MDLDELRPLPPRQTAIGDDLSTLSIAELTARIEAFKREIERVEAEIAAKRAHEAAASALFKAR